jgi:hypothetical protein
MTACFACSLVQEKVFRSQWRRDGTRHPDQDCNNAPVCARSGRHSRLCRMASIDQMDQEEIEELLDSEGGREAGMDSLRSYRACLQHFAERTAQSVTSAHAARWAATHEAWRIAGGTALAPEPTRTRAQAQTGCGVCQGRPCCARHRYRCLQR